MATPARCTARIAWQAAVQACCRRRASSSSAAAESASPSRPPPPPVRLLRDYVAASLASYFSRPGPACPVGSGARLPPIASLTGQAAYEAAVERVYAGQPPGAWLTPAELFSPHYGSALAAFILRHHASHAEPGAPLHIVEVGAGRGTLARDVLDAVRAHDSGSHRGGLYERTRYATLDVSPALAAEAATAVRGAGHDAALIQTLGDACEAEAWAAVADKLLGESGSGGRGGAGASPPRPYVLCCEVLDNLPHDKAVREAGAWAQVMVAWAGPGGGPPEEVLAPLADPVVAACLAAALECSDDGGEAAATHTSLLSRLADFALGVSAPPALSPTTADCLFLPTGAARLLAAAAAAFPAHTLLALDFDALPATTLPAAGTAAAAACWGAPIVSGPPAPGQAAVDWPDLYAPPFGTADIFFPTDFSLLARLARRVGGGGTGANVTTTVAKSGAFLRAHAPPAALAATTTAAGWNPMLDDFVNTSALIVERI